MDIIFHEESKQFHLYNDEISYVMCILENGEIGNLYYGKRIHDKEDLSYLLKYISRPLVSGDPENENFSLELVRQEYPQFGTTDLRTGAFEIEYEDGSRISALKYVSHEIFVGKKKLEGLPATYTNEETEAMTLEITLQDEKTCIEIVLSTSIFKDYPVIAKNVKITNAGKAEVKINKALSLNLDLPDSNYEWMQFSGAWGRERKPVVKKIGPGITLIESKRGHSSAVHNPFVILKRPDATEQTGDAIGFSFVYSGNFQALAEGDTYGALRFMMGINPTWFRWPLKSQESFQTPEVVMVYSSRGLNHLSQSLHKLYRKNLSRGQWKEKERPILLNNWEATEMDFDEESILKIAKKGKDVGVELFVLDDGWFGARNNDFAGLGDWSVNTKKLPEGIKGLAEKVNAMELNFGLWIEPEMVNPDSDLYRAHPDWILGVPGRKNSLGRHQCVLDFSRQEVVDNLYNQLYAVISNANISYIKWDMNRTITECYSQNKKPEEQGMVFHKYILGVYSLYERLIAAFPHILFESCASGGGRFDAGMLYYAPQAWCSDDTDGHERVEIQFGTSYGYPLSSMGAHVSAVPNGQTGRSVNIESRANIAMFGTFGYELDLNHLPDDEIEIVKKQIEFMKAHRKLIQSGNLYRMTNPFDNNIASWMVVSEDQSEAIIAYYKTLSGSNVGASRIYPVGLDSNAAYKIDGEIFYGDELMNVGIDVPDMNFVVSGDRGDFVSKVIYVTK